MKNRLIRSNISDIEEKSGRRSRVQAPGFREKSRERETRFLLGNRHCRLARTRYQKGETDARRGRE